MSGRGPAPAEAKRKPAVKTARASPSISSALRMPPAGQLPADPRNPLTPASVLGLQRLAGNYAVERLLHDTSSPIRRAGAEVAAADEIAASSRPPRQVAAVNALPWTARSGVASLQRAPKTAERHAPARQAEGPVHYADFLNAISEIAVAASEHHGSGLGGLQLGGGLLSPRQRDLLLNLRTACVMAYSSAPGQHRAALDLWEKVNGDLYAAVGRAQGSVDSGVAEFQADLTWIGEKLIRPAAYYEAHYEGIERSDLQAPDDVAQQERLKDVASEFETINEMMEKATELTGSKIIDRVVGEEGIGKEIFEVVKSPHEIAKWLKEFREKGLLAKGAHTVDLLNKLLSARNACLKVTFEVCKRYADAKHLAALGEKAVEAAEHWKGIAEGFEKKLAMVEKVAKVAKVIGVVVSAVKIIAAIIKGDWAGALKEAGNLTVSLALGEVIGAAPVAGVATVAVVAMAEVQAIHDAAAFIRWCNDETVRQAAGDFIDTCVKVSKYPAQDLVADVIAFYDPANEKIQDIITKKITGYAPAMQKDLAAIGSHVSCTEKQCLGSHGDLVYALGKPALHVLRDSIALPDDPLSMAEQIRDVFAGANAMSKYVREAYPTDPQKAADDLAKNKNKKEED